MSEPKISLSSSANDRIATLLKSEPEGTLLRLSVIGGGCSGFQYDYSFTQEPATDDDLILGTNGAIIAIDSMSQEFLGGAQIDFVSDLMGQSFQITNPNVVASCGCGTSFSV